MIKKLLSFLFLISLLYSLTPLFSANAGVPPPSGSDCCVPHFGLGCDDSTCESIVCAVDPFCCNIAWDGICANEALGNIVIPGGPCSVCVGVFKKDIRLDLVVNEGCDTVSVRSVICDSECFTFFPSPTFLVLTATAKPGYVFTGWSGSPECVGTDPNLEFNINEDTTCGANCEKSSTNQLIPWVASIFQSQEGEERQELLILITPTIVTPDEKLDETIAQEVTPLQNVVVIFNLPDGVIANSASVDGNEEACEVVNESQIRCTIQELTEETTIILDVFVPDLGGDLLSLQLLLTTDTFPGITLEQLLNIVAGSTSTDTSSSNGCTIANSGTSKASIFLFALLPTLVFFRRLIKK